MRDEGRVTEFTVENAQLIFKNFQGKASDFNAEGDRRFGLLLSEEDAERLAAEGWNVKHLRPKPDDDTEYRQPWLQIKVKYGKIPPIAMLITSRGKTRLTEETIGQLDYARIKYVDLIVRPYRYPAMNGRPEGISAYLKSIYVTIQEDALEEKYGSLPDADDEGLPFED